MLSLNTACFLTFNADTHAHLVKPERAALSLSKMVDMTHAAEDIVRGHTTYEDALADIQSSVKAPPAYPPWLALPAFAAISFIAAPLFSGSILEMCCAGFAGFLIALMDAYSVNHENIGRGHDLLGGLIASVVAVLCHCYVSRINVLAATFSAIIMLLPGLRSAQPQ